MMSAAENLIEVIRALPDFDTTSDLLAIIAAHDLLAARLDATVERVDRSGDVGADGAVSTASWLRNQASRTYGDAKALVKRATRLRACPQIAAAWSDGRLSSAQIDVIVAAVNDRTEAVLSEHDAGLLATLVDLSTRDTERAMRHWATRAEALAEGPPLAARERSLHLSAGWDGTAELSGHLDGAGFEIVDTALDAATTDDHDGEPARCRSQKRADALIEICRSYLDRANVASTARRRPHVQVVITLNELERGAGRNLDGQPVDAATISSLLCDAGIHRFVTDGASVTLDAGRTTRTVNHHLFTALALRDQGCRFPDCDRAVSWCEAHHAVPWQHGGLTTLENLVLLCWRHHHDFAHRADWQLELLPDATVEVTNPDGRVFVSRPPPLPPMGSGLQISSDPVHSAHQEVRT